MRSRFQLSGALSNFRRSRSGQVSIFFASVAIPTLMMVGSALDYSHAVGVRSKLQQATDAAALAATTVTSGNLTDVQTAANKAFGANMGDTPGAATVTMAKTADGGGWRAEGSIDVSTSFMKIANINSLTVKAVAEAAAFAGGGAIEVALVLDNTGSMLNDMTALKAAAKKLTDQLFDAAQANPKFRMSVVPFVAAVNPGKDVMTAGGNAMIDTLAKARYNGQALGRWAWIATNTGPDGNPCVADWGSGGGGWVDPGAGGGDKKTEINIFEPLTKFGYELFGIKSAHADGAATPNTVPTLSGTTNTSKAPNGGTGQFVPSGFNVDGLYGQGPSNNNKGCLWLANPGTISNWDMFSRIPSSTLKGGTYSGWKGCVEARPAPYDIRDDEPNPAIPDTLYVPYFAPDDGDQFDPSWVPKFNNNYLPDGYIDTSAMAADNNKIKADPTNRSTTKWHMKWDLWARQYNLLKYNGVNKADIVDTYDSLGNHITTGPNANCPDSIQPLTNDRSAVQNKINSLTHWAGGGTIVPEGLAWGLRSISPNKPFSLGSPYDEKTQKIIVLMTDGKNELALNGANWGPTVSDYTAYGSFWTGHFGENSVQTFTQATDYLNNRLIAACDYAKSKPGVKIYTVIFRETDATIKNLLAKCATDPTKSFTAGDGPALAAAFGQISGNIAQVRLSR